MQGATGSGRTWQRRSVATPPFFRPTRYPPSPTLPPAPRLPAARAQARALAHRISVCALSSEAPITPGIHGRRGVPPEARIEAPAPSTRRDPRHHQPLPGNTASAFPLVALRIPQIPQGDAFLPGGQLQRPLSWLGRARLPAHLRVLTATTPSAVLSPPRATRIRSRTACNRRAAPLPSIVGAGIEDPCATEATVAQHGRLSNLLHEGALVQPRHERHVIRAVRKGLTLQLRRELRRQQRRASAGSRPERTRQSFDF